MRQLTVHWHSVYKGVIVAIGCVGLVLTFGVIFLYFFAESYFTPNPYIDTTFAPGFTWQAWHTISPEMNKDNVRTLLGEPYSTGWGRYSGNFDIKSGKNYDSYCDLYSEDNAFVYWDFAWIGMHVCYDEAGQVLGTLEVIFYD